MRGQDDGILFKHYEDAEHLWDEERWSDFSPKEFACSHCGEFYFDNWMFDTIQSVRNRIRRPIILNSAHRCVIHNHREGGADRSRHLRLAFDISIKKHNPETIYQAAREAGFTTFGHYKTFLHVDDRPGRRWFTKSGRKTWKFLLAT